MSLEWKNKVLMNEKVKLDPINFSKTDGSFGVERVLPTFEIRKIKGNFVAFDELNKLKFFASSPTLKGLIKLVNPYVKQRTKLF